MDHILELDSLLHDSSDDDELEIISTFAMVKERLNSEWGSRSRRNSSLRRNTIWRNSLQGEKNIFRDYFAEWPVFPPKKFRRRFRMRRDLFMRIHDAKYLMTDILSNGEMLLKSSDILLYRRWLPQLGCSLIE
jgi:hypothetical protein